MTLWRLEILRLVRTRRLLSLAGVFVFFGLLGPLTARYMDRLLANIGGDVQITVPPPTPAAGIAQYTSNAQQIGLLVVLVIAAGALAFDANPQISAFFRTRVESVTRLLVPRYVVSTVAAGGAFVFGTLAAWYQTAVLIGAPAARGMLAGMAFGVLYLAFAVAVVALATALTRTTLTAVVLAVATLLGLPLLGLIRGLREWLPSHLLGALDGLLAGAAAGDYLRAAAVTVATIAALLLASSRLLQRREI